MLASGDVLVGILDEEAGVFSVPSKTLSYLCAARPLLLAVPKDNLAARITRQQGAGITVAPKDMEGFLAAAGFLHASPDEREEFGKKARAYAEARIAAYVSRVVAEAPELLPEQRDRLALILRGDAA